MTVTTSKRTPLCGVRWSLSDSHGWYDFTLSAGDGKFLRRFAGRLETGKDSYCDPAMGAS